MKQKIQILLALLFISSICWSQQVEISGIYYSSSILEFNNGLGYSMGYNHFIKKSRLGISFRQYSFNKGYDKIYTSSSDGFSKYIEEYSPKHKRIGVYLDYSYKIVEHEKSNLYAGLSTGINYYILKGSYTSIANGNNPEGDFTYDKNENNRIGFGFLIEYELTEVISKRISTSMRINPEVASLAGFGMTGIYTPGFATWMNFSVSLKYKFKD